MEHNLTTYDEDGYCIGTCTCGWARQYKHGEGTIPEVRTSQRRPVSWTGESAVMADHKLHVQTRAIFDEE